MLDNFGRENCNVDKLCWILSSKAHPEIYIQKVLALEKPWKKLYGPVPFKPDLIKALKKKTWVLR